MMMDTQSQYAIGGQVACSGGGPCGRLTRVIVDPVARTLTHLVVEPDHGAEPARLVPVELVDAGAQTDGIALHCDEAAFLALEGALESSFVPAEKGGLGYSAKHMSYLPYFPLSGATGVMTAGPGGIAGSDAPEPQVVGYERVPAGEVQIRRGQHVHAADGAIGRVQGLVVDPRDHHVTHVLLQEGHLWGRKDVAIPITAVTSALAGIELSLSKAEVRDLPEVEIGRGE